MFTPRRLYLAHPTTNYGQPLEARVIESLYAANSQPGREFVVVNPNHPEHDAGYKARGMAYFIGLCDTCDACAYLTFPDGTIGAGVAKEVQSFFDRKVPVFEIHPLQSNVYLLPATLMPADRILSVEATRAKRLLFVGFDQPYYIETGAVI